LLGTEFENLDPSSQIDVERPLLYGF